MGGGGGRGRRLGCVVGGRADEKIRGYEDTRILVRMFSAGDFGDIQRLFRNRPEYVRARSGRCGVRVPGTNAWLYLYKQGGFWCGAVAVGQTMEGFGGQRADRNANTSWPGYEMMMLDGE